jgi:PAS domain S-box-containing protein
MPSGRLLSEDVGARLRLAAIVQSSHDAIISTDLNGIIQSWNPAAERMFGFSEAEALGQSIGIFVSAEQRDEQRRILDRVRGGELVTDYETKRVTKSGRCLDVSVTASPVRDEAGTLVGISGIVRDVTERNRALAALRESEERFRVMADDAPILLWMSGTDKLCTYFNRPWLEFTGRPLSAELGNGWAEGVHADDRQHCVDLYQKAFDRRDPFTMEYRLRRHDGEYRWVLDSGAPRLDADGRFAGYIGSATDVTEHRLVEDALSNLNRRLLESLENERSRIARELHDDFAQRMALMAMELDALGNALRNQDMRGTVQRLYDRAAQLSSDLQTVSHNLHPGKLESLGLVAAADVFCREMSAQHYVTVDFHHEGVPERISKAVALGLFRVLQEALTNGVKHSRTHEFRVVLRGEDDVISLEVVDRGVGFDVQARSSNGLGLLSMRERLALIGGGIAIDSRPGHGTAVRVHVPLQREDHGITSV